MQIEENLLKNVMTVKFYKSDNTLREMRCTKNLDLIPVDKHPKGSSRKTNDNVVTAYDLDKQEWRSFVKNRLISYQFQE